MIRGIARDARRLVARGGLRTAALVLGCLSAGPGTAAAQAPVSPTASIGGLEARFVDVKGVRTRYYDYGQGEPMVLVHGSGFARTASANTWAKNIPGLARRFRVLALDKVSSGMTDDPVDDRSMNMQGEVEHVYQFIQTMKLGKVHLMGQSTGGATVFFTAVAHPEVVRSLLIVNSGPAAPEVGLTSRQDVLKNCPPRTPETEFTEWKCRLRALSYAPDLAFDDEFWAAGAYLASLPTVEKTRAKLAAGAGQPLRSQFSAWKKAVHERVKAEGTLMMPVLLYWSRNDPNSPPGFPPAHEALALYDVIGEKNPRVRLILANKLGHFHYRESPEEFNHNVISFIDYWNTRQ